MTNIGVNATTTTVMGNTMRMMKEGKNMSHLNIYSQKGCIGCKPCERGSANIGRSAVLWTIGILTAGMGLIILPFFKKCQYCGHNSFMNRHFGPDPRETPHQDARYFSGGVA